MAAARNLHPVPVYTGDELDAQRLRAIRLFIDERRTEGATDYEDTYHAILPIVTRLFRDTSNLTALDPAILTADPELLDSLRFLAGPPVSEDDLDTLAQHNIAKRKTLPANLAQVAIDVLGAMIDTIRCPWLAQGRPPRRHELSTAVRWTTGLMAVETMKTDRRTESAHRQQEAVRQVLLANQWTEVPTRDIRTLDDLPRGSFSGESLLGGNKCDVPIRLRDGRLLAVECKVSNSGTNSVKRLIRETGGKAEQWRAEFGNQVITASVLAGVYKLTNLLDAQQRLRMAIFWEHDLQHLLDFVQNAQ